MRPSGRVLTEWSGAQRAPTDTMGTEAEKSNREGVSCGISEKLFP